ncbi:glycoside hydrolase family 13 protein [Nocardioides sp. GY 10113]|uniref:glycoside hydrolase family 13 protein n=1 Tax=Nocardioides sp. GY 10113 TaxID=2569761 RepID=UPI0010A94A88|nr:glycoside hydrolase family 13 protein [Nocardioides sp. GY 10113]TIC88216.1 glycoside hydrolase family 13 protein [Nocardioides sp. GY 10113]
MTTTSTAAPWWREAVVYQVYVRSFADCFPAEDQGGGDGIGDLPGITHRLPHLRDLGVDALWITPFYTSPQADHGYDVADYTDVDPLFGDLADFDALLARAHELGLRVIVDLVPNHTSSAHAWFQAALAAPPGSPERARYLFRDGKGPDGEEPPNNWESIFGGPAWTRVTEADGTPGQWYLHLFDSSQPDLDWRNPEVGDMFEDVLRCWLDRGVDGFRVDVAHGMYKEESLRDQVRPEPPPTPTPVDHADATDADATDADATDADPTGAEPAEPAPDQQRSMVERTLRDEPMWEQPEVHEVYRRWRRVLDGYPGDRMAVAEAWTQTSESMAHFIRPDELHQAFNFGWLGTPWSAQEFAQVVNSSLEAVAAADALPTWVLSNHDVERHPTRYGGGEVGLARGRAATLTMLALPGSAYLYQGEELGLEQVDVPPEARQDPSWFRTGKPGRDGCRVPMPWSGDAPPYGFGGTGQPWIPQPEDWAGLTVAAQAADPDSTLSFYRRALAARREHLSGAGDAATATVTGDLLEIRRGDLRVLLNAGSEAVPLPAGEVLISSDPVGPTLPPNTAAWLR